MPLASVDLNCKTNQEIYFPTQDHNTNRPLKTYSDKIKKKTDQKRRTGRALSKVNKAQTSKNKCELWLSLFSEHSDDEIAKSKTKKIAPGEASFEEHGISQGIIKEKLNSKKRNRVPSDASSGEITIPQKYIRKTVEKNMFKKPILDYTSSEEEKIAQEVIKKHNTKRSLKKTQEENMNSKGCNSNNEATEENTGHKYLPTCSSITISKRLNPAQARNKLVNKLSDHAGQANESELNKEKASLNSKTNVYDGFDVFNDWTKNSMDNLNSDRIESVYDVEKTRSKASAKKSRIFKSNDENKVKKKLSKKAQAEEEELQRAYEEWCKECQDVNNYKLIVEHVDHDY